MSSFNANINSQSFDIATENELAIVLSHYSSEFVFTIVKDAMRKRFSGMPIIQMPNVVSAWEQNFKAILMRYGQENAVEVNRVRSETYKEIIGIICKEFGLNFTIDDNVDLYSAAYYLYDLFVCRFSSNMVNFFGNYIYRERDSLYESLNLSDLKKNKDSSSAYGKKVFKDQKLAVINANIDFIISMVCSLDFPFYTIIGNIYGMNSELTGYISTIVSADKEFFINSYVSLINSEIRPEIITSIRFKMQELAFIEAQIDTSNIPGFAAVPTVMEPDTVETAQEETT